ncbi:MAG: multiheme c-type cytochrome [Myxococcaceae bacterium]
MVAVLLLAGVPAIDTPQGPRDATSAWCGSCHASQFEQWRSSMHAQAATNRWYAANHSQWPLKWCDECHLPLAKEEEGVGCASCHVSERTVLTTLTPTPKGLAAHVEKKSPALSTEAACERCHQFNMPRGQGEPEQYTQIAFQNTIAEWKAWGSNRPCTACHFPKGNHASTGGHDLERLQRGLGVQVISLGRDEVEISVLGRKAGHAVPTGDAFRVVRVELYDAEGAMVGRERYGHFGPAVNGRPEDRTAPPPPTDGGTSARRFVVRAPLARSYKVFFEYVGPLTAPLIPKDAEVELASGRIDVEDGSP